MSVLGTDRTNRAGLMMSVDRGRPEWLEKFKTARLTQTGHSSSATLDRLSRLGDHAAVGELGCRHGRRRLAAEAWPRTI
jgi:hypothetical protein